MKKMRTLLALVLAVILAAGAAGAGGGRAAAAGTARVDARLLEALAAGSGPVAAVVTFRGEGAPGPAQLDLLTRLDVTRGFTFQSLPMAGVLLTAGQVEALAAQPEVRSIYLNRPLTYYNAEATAMTGVDKVRTDPAMTAFNGGLPVTGRGVTVLVNDSGVDGTHADIQYGSHLIQNAMGSTNLNAYSALLPITYVEGVPNTDSNSGHGTHVAGIVGGTGAMSGGKYEGVAPGASLMGYGSGAALFVLDAVGGFDYALTHQAQYGIRVITNSWGSSGDFDPEDPVNIASYLAYKRNMVVTFAAGNEGPGADTHNPYAKAPWVISVAAGDKQGRLADFSSRGVKGKSGTVVMDGATWTWEDRPTITAPGVDIISTRALGPVSSLGATSDVDLIEPAYLPYYTTMSGTSMATPHVAGIAALMLEVNPRLTPAQIKQILQETATNMPGREPWEVGAGYVNAYAAVQKAIDLARPFGATVNMTGTFNSSATLAAQAQPFTVDYNPLLDASSNSYPFAVPAGSTNLVVTVYAGGLLDSTGNPVNLILHGPDGSEYSSGVSLLFPLYMDRTVAVSTPVPGRWTAELRGLRGDAANPTNGLALPQQVAGTITLYSISNVTGLNDIAGHPAADAIKLGVSLRLFDGLSGGQFKPDSQLLRRDLARYLVMGAAVRQWLPSAGRTYSDVSAADQPFVEAVAVRGAALRDRAYAARGVMLPTGANTFSPSGSVDRASLAYSLVQSLGLESEALARNGQALTVQYGGSRIPIDDAQQVPAELRGYVQLALDLNILGAYFSVQQGPFDLQPTVHANFRPAQTVTRGDFAVAMTRFWGAYMK